MTQQTTGTPTLLDELSTLKESHDVYLTRMAELKENNSKAELDIRTRMDELSALQDKHRAEYRTLGEKDDALRKELRENTAIGSALKESPAADSARMAEMKENNSKAELDIRTRMDELSALQDKHRAADRTLGEKDDALRKELRENSAEYRALNY